MNLAKFDTRAASEEGQWLDILDWDWETKIGFRVKVLGPDSITAARINDEEEKAMQSKIAALYAKGVKAMPEEDALSVEKAINKAVKLTVAWEGAEWDGKELPFNAENAKMLYTQCSHIRTQVLAFFNTKANFTRAESSSSAPSSDSASPSTTRGKKGR